MTAGRRIPENWARHGVAVSVSLGVAAVGSVATGNAAGSIVLAAALFLVLEGVWALHAFEVSPAYRRVQNRDLARMVGERGVVTKECSPSGQARVMGELWQAEAADGAAIRVGAEVLVKGVRGLILLVAKP